MSCPKHRELEEALKTERYKAFKPTTAEERLERDCFGNTQADLVAKIRRGRGGILSKMETLALVKICMG